MCMAGVAGQMSIAFFLMFVLFSFVMFGSVENINDAAHMLGVVDSAMNKLEALENVNYIDQDGTDIKPQPMILSLGMFLSDMTAGLFCMT